MAAGDDHSAGDTRAGGGGMDDLEEAFGGQQTSAGYESGLEKGRAAGQEEGLLLGQLEGAKIGSELGYYKGFTTAWLHLLQEAAGDDESNQQAKTNKLNEVLKLVDEFPKTNETFCEEKLTNIRVKFKQSTTLLQVKPYFIP